MIDVTNYIEECKIKPKFIKKPVAYCESGRCVRIDRSKPWREHSGIHNRVAKDVATGTFECPDCGCALVWRKIVRGK